MLDRMIITPRRRPGSVGETNRRNEHDSAELYGLHLSEKILSVTHPSCGNYKNSILGLNSIERRGLGLSSSARVVGVGIVAGGSRVVCLDVSEVTWLSVPTTRSKQNAIDIRVLWIKPEIR